MFGLVRGLVEWLPTSAAWAGYVAGPLVLLGYLAGSLPFGDLVVVRRFRRQLDHGRLPTPALDAIDTASAVTSLLAAVVTLLAATIAWDVGREVSPPAAFSAVGTYSNQALGAWSSIALWTGTAAALGSMAPVWTRFRRGGSGIGPALALLVAYTPLLAATALAVGSFTYAITQRFRPALWFALATMIVVEYVAWVGDLQTGWGITNGPEAGLWSVILAAMLLAPRPD